jgi:hypothetical protein
MFTIESKIIQDFITLFLGLVVEAFPFVILGVLISTLIGIYLKEEFILRYLPKNQFVSNFLLSISGILLPVCECGNVPVARRLLSKGFSVAQTTTFLLAAPIVNPITFYATIAAFSFDPFIAFTRILAAIVIANFVGFIIGLHKQQENLLTKEFYDLHCRHDGHDHARDKVNNAINIFQQEFVEVTRMLIIGALIATASQVLIPRELIVEIGANPVLSVAAMMLLAFVISICANVDAFFALSYANSFSLGSLLSFLVFGPMIDIKMLTMLKTTFTVKYLVIVTALVGFASFILGLGVNYLI